MENYESLLTEAYKNIKEVKGSERFEIPRAEGHFEGKKTIITNFMEIVNYMRRAPEHFLKFILRELATSGETDNERLILNMKIPSARINQKIQEYSKEFVICRECGKPDTELRKEGRLTFIHCMACGAKHPVRSKI